MAQEQEKFELMKLDPNQVVELDQWESKLKTLVEENPFIEITDKKSFDEAKKRRTALKSGRTEVQKQDGLIATFLNNFRKATKGNSEKLISIVEPHEQKQQDEIDRYQKILDDQKAEQDRIEEERVNGIKSVINETEKQLQSIVDHVIFQNIEVAKKDFDEYPKKVVEGFDFQEFNFLFDEMVERMKTTFDNRVKEVQEEEQKRLEDLKNYAESKLNKMCLDAQNAIEQFQPKNEDDNLIETIDEIFDPLSFDFGEMSDEHAKQKSIYIQKALTRIDQLNEMVIAEQRQRIFDVREGLLDIIFQMDVENFTEKTNYVKEALEQDCLPEVQQEFDKMKSMVEKSLSQKLEILSKEIEAKKEAEAKEEERMAKVMDERIKIIEGLGMVANEDETIWTGFGLELFVDKIYNEDSIDSIVQEINDYKSESEAEQKRQELIRQDKITMVDAFVQIKNKLFETTDQDFENQSTFVYFSQLRKQMIELCDSNIVEINKF
jgi:hypothetical protein